MLHLLKPKHDRYLAIEELIQQPEVIAQSLTYANLLKERGQLRAAAELYREYQRADAALAGAKEILADAAADAEMKELAQSEIDQLSPQLATMEQQAQEMLLLGDDAATGSCIVEIRAGTGGQEACLFAGDLFEMYEKYSALHDLKLEVMERMESELGGIKTLVFRVEGEDASRWFRYEGGTHRVQRVPATEAQGRIHTSAATVAVLPEPEEVDIKIEEKDIEVTAARSGGPGGQNVNKVASKCQILHIPSGLRVECQETKSFHQNRERAMALLRARLYDAERSRIESERSSARATMIGSGDRSEKIRTYNWPQNRCTDHRCKCTINLDVALAGKLDEVVTEMRKLEVAERLKALEQASGS